MKQTSQKLDRYNPRIFLFFNPEGILQIIHLAFYRPKSLTVMSEIVIQLEAKLGPDNKSPLLLPKNQDLSQTSPNPLQERSGPSVCTVWVRKNDIRATQCDMILEKATPQQLPASKNRRITSLREYILLLLPKEVFHFQGPDEFNLNFSECLSLPCYSHASRSPAF